MSAADKVPQWIRVSTSDMTSAEGRYILGGKSSREWADYGRWFALLQLVARSPEGLIDVSDQRRLKSLAVDLALTPKACKDWLGVLVDGGAIEREAYEARGWICIPCVFNDVQSYKSQVRVNRLNGAKGGRPRKKKTETTTTDKTET